MIFAIFLVLIGFVWLLSNLGLITTTVSQIAWPFIIIAIGLTLLLKKKDHPFGHWYCGWRDKEKEEEEHEEKEKD